MILFYAKPENFVLKCKFNSKSLASPFEKFWLRRWPQAAKFISGH